MLLMLDIDGVLNTPESGCGRPFNPRYTAPTKELVNWDEQCVDNLIEIVAQTNCKIVISSAWRHDFHYTDIGRMLERYGGHRDWVVGQTPTEIPRQRYLQGVGLYPGKGDEVGKFLHDTGYEGAYVILDDRNEFYSWQPFIQVPPKTGLTHIESKLAIAVLREQAGRMTA